MPVKLAALDMVWLFIAPEVVIVLIPLSAPELTINPLMVLVVVGAVMALLNVLAPANVCVPVDTRPTLVASAVCKYRLVPDITAPFALLVCESMVPTVFTALLAQFASVRTQIVSFAVNTGMERVLFAAMADEGACICT